MKIGIVCPYDMTRGGGVQEIVKNQAHGLRKRGHEVWIVTPKPISKNHYSDEATIFIGSATGFKSPGNTAFELSAGLSGKVQSMLDEHKFDILHFHEPWVPMLSSQILSRSTSVNVATFHAKMPDNAMMRTMAKAAVPYAKSIIKYIDVFCAASEPGAEYITSLTDQPVHLVPVDIDITKFTRPEKFSDFKKSKTILYVGRLEARKGVKYLLQALQVLHEKHPDVTLDLLGNGVDVRKLKVLAEDLGLKNVNFLGYLGNDDKIKRYQTADLFCAPSIYGEGFGMVLLEAMATGLPIVAGDNPGYASVMKGFGELSLVKPQDTANFARRLDLMLYQNSLRDLWREWAAKEVWQYRTESMLDKYEAIYKKALLAHSK